MLLELICSVAFPIEVIFRLAVVDGRWPLRPEYVESLYVMWRLERMHAEAAAREPAPAEASPLSGIGGPGRVGRRCLSTRGAGGARACGRPRLTAYVVPWACWRACGGADKEGGGERNRGLLLRRRPGAFPGGAGMHR